MTATVTAAEIACPHCLAPPLGHCLTPGGHVATRGYHAARHKAAEAENERRRRRRPQPPIDDDDGAR